MTLLICTFCKKQIKGDKIIREKKMKGDVLYHKYSYHFDCFFRAGD